MAKTVAMARTGNGGAGNGDKLVPKIIAQVKSWKDRSKDFYTDVRTEMKKVSSPSLKEVQATTAVVIIAVFLFALYFWGVDTIMDRAVVKLLHSFTR